MDTTLLITLAVIGLIVVIGGAVAVRLTLPKLIQASELSKMREEEKPEYAVKAELLENAEVVELLAPSSEFQVPIERGGDKPKKPHQQQAWLSPYPEAVKRANKRHKNELKRGNALTLTRKQIAAAAGKVSIEVMPEGLQPANAGPEHSFITFKLQGTTEQKIQALAPQITSQLGLQSLTKVTAPDYRSVRYEAHTVEPVDRLTKGRIGKEFFEAHPAFSPTSIPLACTASGDVWSLPLHHTLIIGMTGSGKGSPLQGIIRQLAPFVEQGIVRLYGGDPKASELMPYEESGLFRKLAYDIEDIADIITTVYNIMRTRAKNKRMDLENAELGRSLEFTEENPAIVLPLDEFLELLINLNASREYKDALVKLTGILAQGRSLGVFVIAATQEADKELLGRMRNNFANVIVLKQPSPYFNDLFLGEGAAAAGFDSTKIAPANKANGYATAGIGYVKEETGNPVRVRFAYSSDRDIADLILSNPGSGEVDEWEFTEIDSDESDDDGFESDNALPKL